MRGVLALIASAVLLFNMSTRASAGCDPELADTDLNVAGGMSEAEVADLLERARDAGSSGDQVATGGRR